MKPKERRTEFFAWWPVFIQGQWFWLETVHLDEVWDILGS